MRKFEVRIELDGRHAEYGISDRRRAISRSDHRSVLQTGGINKIL